MKSQGTYEIRRPTDGSPVSRMSVEYVCEDCGDRRLLMRGGTPHRTVSIELSPEGYLLSMEYLHPNNLGVQPDSSLPIFPPRARCSECHHDAMFPGAITTYC